MPPRKVDPQDTSSLSAQPTQPQILDPVALRKMQRELAKCMRTSEAIFDAAAALQLAFEMRPRTLQKRQEKDELIAHETADLKKYLHAIGQPEAYADCIMPRSTAEKAGGEDILEVWGRTRGKIIPVAPVSAEPKLTKVPQPRAIVESVSASTAPLLPKIVLPMTTPEDVPQQPSIETVNTASQHRELPVPKQPQQEEAPSLVKPTKPNPRPIGFTQRTGAVAPRPGGWVYREGGKMPTEEALIARPDASSKLTQYIAKYPKIKSAVETYQKALNAEHLEPETRRERISDARTQLESELRLNNLPRHYVSAVVKEAGTRNSGGIAP